MKILHTADWHLGKIVNEYNLLSEQEIVLEQIINLIEQENVDVLLISGDVFDRSVASAKAMKLFDETMIKLIAREIKVIIIGGNHDGYERLEYAKTVFAQNGVYIQANHNELYHKITINNHDFYLVNYFDPTYINNIVDSEEIKTHDEAFGEIIKSIEKEFNPDNYNIMLAHGYFSGRVNDEEEINYENSGLEISDSERPLAIGGTDIIDVSIAKMFNYIALGHLHGRQQVLKDKCFYSGSIYPYSFSEVNHKKGCYVIDTDNQQIDFHEFKLARKLVEITGKFEQIIENYQKEPVYDYVKINLDEHVPIINVVEKLKPIFPNIMQITYKKSDNNSLSVLNEEINLSSGVDNLFFDFFTEITKKELEPNQVTIIQEIVAEIKKEENNASD